MQFYPKLDYEKLFRDYRKSMKNRNTGLNFIREKAKNNRIALMCFELDAGYCHRREIGHVFKQEGFLVTEI